MKNILLFVLILSISTVFGQRKVSVTTADYTFSVGEKPAYISSIYEVPLKDVIKAWKKVLKSKKAKVSSDDDEIFGDNAKIKTFPDNNPVDIYTVFVDQGNNEVKMYSAVNLGGVYLNAEHAEKDAAFKALVLQFALELTQKDIMLELKKEEASLKKMQAQEKKLVTKKASLESKIEKLKQKITDAEAAIEQNIKDQESKNQEIETQTTKVEEVQAKMDEFKSE